MQGFACQPQNHMVSSNRGTSSLQMDFSWVVRFSTELRHLGKVYLALKLLHVDLDLEGVTTMSMEQVNSLHLYKFI